LRALEVDAMNVQPAYSRAIVLPCALKRPYDTSRTHKRLYRIAEEQGYDMASHHKIVVTSLGVIPEELWAHPAVLTYDAGVPDIYRILRLVRKFFSKNPYEYVADCLQFYPYSDVLSIAAREGIIRDLRLLRVPRKRQFFLRW
jgi:predicted RNA-binding protein